MPAGVTWPRYLRFFAAAMFTMMAGAQVVHLIYRPLDDLDEWVERERAKAEEKKTDQLEENT